MMKKIVLLISILIATVMSTTAQQDALYSQYMFNPFAINPAYAGSRDALSTVILAREQWSGMDGAPFTGSVAVHGPIKETKLAGGFNFVHDELGPTTTNAAYLTGAYHLKMPVGKLSFGLRFGGIFNTYDYTLLNYDQPDKYSDVGSNISEFSPSFDFGAYYYTNQFYAGLATTHMGGTTINQQISDSLNSSYNYQQHYFLASGAAFKLNSDLVLKPSFLIKYVSGAPVNVDINMSMLFKKVFWFGFSYRHTSAIAVITEYNLTDWMRLGYSYDIVLNRLKRFTGGSHELFIGFDFLLRTDKDISPRYM